jgi:molybdate transport system substrate-binding protein
MKTIHYRSVATAALASIMSFVAATVQGSELKVLADSPLQPALTKVAELFEQETRDRILLTFDPSPAVKKRIEQGERADVVIVQPDFVEELTSSGKVRSGDRPIIGKVGVGLGNRRDSPVYDISTPEKLKQVLLRADLLVFNSVISGNTFFKALERLGIAETLKSKIVRTTPNGIFEPILIGHGNDFLAGTMPLIATRPELKLLGPLPDDLQTYLTYTAVLMTDSSQSEIGRSLIRFLISSKAKGILAANGVSQ